MLTYLLKRFFDLQVFLDTPGIIVPGKLKRWSVILLIPCLLVHCKNLWRLNKSHVII